MDSYTFSSDSTSSFFVKETSSDESNLLAPGNSSFIHLSSKEELGPEGSDSNVKEGVKPDTTANISFGSDFKDDPPNMNASDIFIITINENHSENNVENNSKINLEVPETIKMESNTESVNNGVVQDNVTDLFTPDTGLSELLLSDAKNSIDYNEELQLSSLPDDKSAETFDMEHFLSFKRGKATKSSKESNKSVSLIKKYFVNIGSNMVQCILCSDRLVNKTSNLILHYRMVHRNNKNITISQKQKVSKVWNFFTKVDPFKAKCNLCSNLLIFKNRISNLTKHLRAVHKQLQDFDSSIEKPTDKSTSECETVQEEKVSSPSKDVIVIQTPKGKLLNQIKVETEKSWKCFTKLPDSDNMVCNLCTMVLSHDKPSVLLEHLRAQHKSILNATGLIQSTVSDTKITVKAEELNKSKENTSSSDNLHEHMSGSKESTTGKVDKTDSVAENSSSIVVKTTEKKKSPGKSHLIWNYFKDYKNGKVSCNVCKKTLVCNFSTSNMLRHLKCVHDNLYNIVKGIKVNETGAVKKLTDPEELNKIMKNFTFIKKIGKFSKVKCNECKVVMTYSRSLVANLRRHLNARHSYLFESDTDAQLEKTKSVNEIDEDVGETDPLDLNTELNENAELITSLDKSELSRESKISMSGSKLVYEKSNAWNYFANSETTDNKVICKICSTELVHRKDTYYNLFRHLSLKHSIVFEKIPKPEKVFIYESDEESIHDKKSPKKADTPSASDKAKDNVIDVKGSSRTWKHFTKLDRDKAKCNICSKLLTYKIGQMTNLDMHIQSHNESNTRSKREVKDKINHEKESGKGGVSGKPDVWNYYTKLECNEAMCNLCKLPNIVNYTEHSISSLKRHLRRQHKFILANVEDESASSSNSEDDETENNKSVEVETKSSVAAVSDEMQINNIKSLFDYLVCDDKLKNCIKFENNLIKCKICSGTFSCDNLIKCESTVRYHVQIFHAEWTVNCFENSTIKEECSSPIPDHVDDDNSLPKDSYFTEMKLPIYNELEAIANEVTSFIECKESSPKEVKQNIAKKQKKKKTKSTGHISASQKAQNYHRMLNDNLWTFFTKLTSQIVRCNFCMLVLSFRQNKKWNLLRHLKLKHKSKINEAADNTYSDKKSLPEKGSGVTRESCLANKHRAVARKKTAGTKQSHVEVNKSDERNSPNIKLENRKITNEKRPLPFKAIDSPGSRKFGRTWSHFTKIEMGSAQCNICGVVLFYRGSGIDILNDHLSSEHTGYFDGSEQVEERKSYFKTAAATNLKDDIEADKEESHNKKSEADHEYSPKEVDDTEKSRTKTNKRKKSVTQDSENIENDSSDTNNDNSNTKKQLSPVWKYFNRLENGYAKCHLCLSDISFRGTTSNLLRHLQKIHSVISLPPLENESESFVNKEENEKSLLLAAVNLTPTKVVNEGQLCYVRLDKKSATCNFCHRVVHHKYGNMHKLMSHLLHKHRNDISEYKALKHLKFNVKGKEISLMTVKERRNRLGTHLIENTNTLLDKIDKRKIYRSNTWLYFTKLTDHHAKCNKCFNTFSYKGGSIYNLTRHLLIKHDVKLIKRKEMSHKKLMALSVPTSRSLSVSKKKETLLFFKRVNRNTIKCKLCLRRFLYNGLNFNHLVNHLWSTHISKLVGSDSNVPPSNQSDNSDNSDDNDDHNVGNNSLPQAENAPDETHKFEDQVEDSKPEEDNTTNNCEENTSIHSFNNRGNRFNGIWNYYTDLQDSECNVKCNICQKYFCFRSKNLSNLSRHLELHNIKRPYLENDDNGVNSDLNKNQVKIGLNENHSTLPFTITYGKENSKTSKDNSNLFVFFSKCDTTKQDKVQCKICSEDVYYGGSENVEMLKSHLSIKHAITGHISNNVAPNAISDYGRTKCAQLGKNSNVYKRKSNTLTVGTKVSKMKCKLCYKEFMSPKNKIIAKLLQHLRVDHDLPENEKQLLDELSKYKDECTYANVQMSVNECKIDNVENCTSTIDKVLLQDDISKTNQELDISKESKPTIENGLIVNGNEIVDGVSKIDEGFNGSEESNYLNQSNIIGKLEHGLVADKKPILEGFRVLVEEGCTINGALISVNKLEDEPKDQVSDKANKKMIYDIKINRIISLYYKDFRSFKNKCKVCNKFISIKRPCFHRITNDLCMKYGVRKTKQKMTTTLGTKSTKENRPEEMKDRLEHFVSVNLHENKCFECMELWYDGYCLHSLNSWIMNESKKKSNDVKHETTEYNQVLTDKEVKMITDTFGDCSDNIIIITNDENNLNYDLSNTGGEGHHDISYQIMNSINEIDDEDVRVIIYDYNAENLEENNEQESVKIQEITEVECDETLVNEDVSSNNILDDNMKEFVVQLNKSEQDHNNEEVISEYIPNEEEEEDVHVKSNEEIKEESSTLTKTEAHSTTHSSKLTELAEVSCNEQFYKQNSLSNHQSGGDTEIPTKPESTEKCIVESLYQENKNTIDLAATDKTLMSSDDIDHNKVDTKELDVKLNVSCDDNNVESCVIHVPENVDEIEPFKQVLRSKHNEVLSEEVINAIFNEFTVNFQNNDGKDEVKAIKIVDNLIHMPSGLYFQDLVSSYKISKSVLHFDNIDYDYKIAKCNLCETYLQFMEPILYNLLMHLFTHHKDKVCAEEPINSDVVYENKPVEVPNKGRRKSQVWKYFSNEKNFRATCKICNFSFSFKGGAINNLSRHLRLRHNIILSANVASPNLDGLVTYPKKRSVVKLRSKTWLYFSKEPNDWARCKICNKYLSYRSSTINNLTRHLRTVHAKIFNCLFNGEEAVHIKNEDGTVTENTFISSSYNNNPQNSLFESTNGKTRDEILQRCSYSTVENGPSKRKSIVWNYFTEFSPNLGKCNFCMKVISCKGGGTSNLSRHLRSRHGIWIVLTSNLTQSFSEWNQSDLIAPSEIQTNQDAETIITQEQLHILKNRKVVHKKSKTWDYFTKESSERVRCNLCAKILSYKCKAVHNLRRHLSKKHPEIIAKPEPIRLKLQINTDNVLHNENLVEDTVDDCRKFIDITDTSVVIVDEENQLPPNRPDRSSQRPKKSIVWNYFQEIEYGVAKCIICAKILSFRGGGTNNLMRHLRCRHAIIVVNHNNSIQSDADQETAVYYADDVKHEIVEAANNIVVFESDQIGVDE